MKAHATVLVLLVVSAARANAAVTITLNSFESYKACDGGAMVLDDPDSLSVHVVSTYSIQSVTAQVAAASEPMRSTNGTDYACAFPMTAVPGGQQVMGVTATDFYGNTGTLYLPFPRHTAPAVTVTSPLGYSFANPTLYLGAVCTSYDDAGCETTAVLGSTTLAQASGSTLTATVSLAGNVAQLLDAGGVAEPLNVIFSASDTLVLAFQRRRLRPGATGA